MLRFVLLSCLGLFVATDASKQQPLEPLTKFRMPLNVENRYCRAVFATAVQVRRIEKRPRENYVAVHTCMTRQPSRCVLYKPNLFSCETSLSLLVCVLRDAQGLHHGKQSRRRFRPRVVLH